MCCQMQLFLRMALIMVTLSAFCIIGRSCFGSPDKRTTLFPKGISGSYKISLKDRSIASIIYRCSMVHSYIIINDADAMKFANDDDLDILQIDWYVILIGTEKDL